MSCNNGQQAIPQAIARAILDTLCDTGGEFDACKLHLYAVNVVVNPNTPLSALIEPTFTGYAAVAAIAFDGAINGPNGSAIALAPSEVFACTGGIPTNTIYGWFLTDSGSTILKLAVPLGTPVQIAQPGDGVDIQPEIVFSGR